MLDLKTIIGLLESKILDIKIERIENSTPEGIEVDKEHIVDVCQVLHESELTYFDQLSCLTGIDNGIDAKSMEVIYHLYSIPKNNSLAIKVTLDREKPTIPSVSHIWRTANWHEREAFDLLGISFENHPDLRRILLPKDWVGHPLRKDYEAQETYHGMTVKYDRDEDSV